MRVKELLNYLPASDLAFLAAETGVDHQVKKLHGGIMFQLLLLSLLDHHKASLRIMEDMFHSLQFQLLSDVQAGLTTRYNSIRDRICQMKPAYFKAIFELLFERFNQHLGEQDAILRYDSTMIAISASLVDWGMRVGSKTDKVQLKVTLATKGSLPCQVHVFTKQEALSEDKTIPLAILQDQISKSGIVVFDRGVQSRKAFRALDAADRLFVTRLSTRAHYEVQRPLSLPAKPAEATVTISQDAWVRLKEDNHFIDHAFRLIQATIDHSQQPIWFLTNSTELSAYQVAAIYKQRWEIESFFKFLKQQLQLEHLVVRHLNGIHVMLYMTLITALLLIIYKKLNQIDSLKRAKLRFIQEVDFEVVQQIVRLCGGNTELMMHLKPG
jgi:transposase